jgi:hypothetical protein
MRLFGAITASFIAEPQTPLFPIDAASTAPRHDSDLGRRISCDVSPNHIRYLRISNDPGSEKPAGSRVRNRARVISRIILALASSVGVVPLLNKGGGDRRSRLCMCRTYVRVADSRSLGTPASGMTKAWGAHSPCLEDLVDSVTVDATDRHRETETFGRVNLALADRYPEQYPAVTGAKHPCQLLMRVYRLQEKTDKMADLRRKRPDLFPTSLSGLHRSQDADASQSHGL